MTTTNETTNETAEAAAFHGLATNLGITGSERLGLALKALELYEAEVERLRPVVEAARAWRVANGNGVQRTLDALIRAVDALDGAS